MDAATATALGPPSVEGAAGRRPWRLTARARKAVLLVHVAAAGAWLGFDLVLGLLVLAAATTEGSTVPAAVLLALGRFATWPLIAVGLLTLASGVLLGLGTRYGLLRYRWVAVKLALTSVLVTLMALLLAPEVTRLAVEAGAVLDGGGPLPDTTALAFPPAVSTTAILVAMTLSVFKPWGRTAWRRSAPGGRRAVAGRGAEEA